MPQRKFKAHMTSEQFNETLRAIMQIPHKRTKFHTKGQIPHKRTKRQFITHFMELIPILYKNIRRKTNTVTKDLIKYFENFSSSW